MKLLRKWDYNMREYAALGVPDEWNVKVSCENMREVVNCVSCGKRLAFGKAFPSMEIHNSAGNGYAVCRKCSREEVRRGVEHHKNR